MRRGRRGGFNHFFRARDIGALQIDLVDDRKYIFEACDLMGRDTNLPAFGLDSPVTHQLRAGLPHRMRASAKLRRNKSDVNPGVSIRLELIGVPVLRSVGMRTRALSFDGNAALALSRSMESEYLRLHFAAR